MRPAAADGVTPATSAVATQNPRTMWTGVYPAGDAGGRRGRPTVYDLIVTAMLIPIVAGHVFGVLLGQQAAAFVELLLR